MREKHLSTKESNLFPTQNIPDRLIPQSLAAPMLGAAETALEQGRCGRGWLRDLPFVKMGPRRVMYRESDIFQFIQQLEPRTGRKKAMDQNNNNS